MSDAVNSKSMMFNEEVDAPRAEAGGVLGMGKKGKKDEKKEEKKDGGGGKKKGPTTEGSKRVKKEKKDGDKTNMTPAPPQGHPIVEQWVVQALDAGVNKLREDFRDLAKYTAPNMTQEAFNKNGGVVGTPTCRNRYQDVPCQDANIVSLVSKELPLAEGANTYIHANFVACPNNPHRFICAQGPLDNTCEDFWVMVVQQKVEQVVMLCKTIETGKNKCAQYWPTAQGETSTFGRMKVENVSGPKPMERDGEIQVTMLKVSGLGEPVTVRHLHWTDWPDRGVPLCKLTSLELLSAVRGSKSPIVVHCSAGIGRTGSIVSIEYILEKIALNSECPPMKDLIKEIRNQRAYSIQNDLQYLFIHRVMLHYFLDKYRDKYATIFKANEAKYKTFVEDYCGVVGQTP